MVDAGGAEDRWSLYARCPRDKGYDDLCFVEMVQGERDGVSVGGCVHKYCSISNMSLHVKE